MMSLKDDRDVPKERVKRISEYDLLKSNINRENYSFSALRELKISL
jgi:hypothetical protein